MSNIPVLMPNASISLAMSENDRRDQFAMAALTGLLANSESAACGAEPMTSYVSRDENAKWVAERVYKIADAMMEARRK